MDSPTTSVNPIEAGSLSSLTALAAEPPLNPRQPSERRREPLTLYLARVPGSRDVFLTPMKPRSKTVTAEDVESCLYYMHFESAEDDDVLAAIKTVPGSSTGMAKHPQSRPLPATPEEPPQLPPRWNVQSPRLPLRPNHVAELRNINGSIRRKPVASSGQPKSDQGLKEPLEYQHPPALPPRPDSAASSRPSLSDRSIPAAILVRRDPSSGVQWNVAKVMDPPVHDVSSTSNVAGIPSRQKGSPIYLEIHTIGYSKFVADSRPTDLLNESRPSRGTPDTVPSLEYSSNSDSMTSGHSGSVIFRRRMWMEGSHFLGGRHRNGGSIDVGLSEKSLFDARLSMDRASSPFEQSSSSLQIPKEGRLIASGERRSIVKGYTFMSPWQGRCEFATSTLGSSLKCRHRLPGYSEPTNVSELRFNLPSRPGHRKSSSHSSILEAGANHSSRPRDRKAHSISSLGDEFDGIDLSLGQELAGGGTTGKQAKLGKLIIENEGMQMMDLVVAANVALWWRAYNRAVDHAS